MEVMVTVVLGKFTESRSIVLSYSNYLLILKQYGTLVKVTSQ